MTALAQPLRGMGRQGDVIHQNQIMGISDGFPHVSQIWLDQCMSYDDVVNKIVQGRAELEDHMITFGDMYPNVYEDRFVMTLEGGKNYRVTPYAMKQLATIAGVSSWQCENLMSPKTNNKDEVVRERDVDDAVTLLGLLNNGLRDVNPEKKFFFRTQKDGTLRAVLSSRYCVMDNLWFLEVLNKILPTGKFSHWREDEDKSTLWGNILIPESLREEQDSDYGAMVSVGNSEIGRRRLSTRPSLFRAICMNGCIWDQNSGEAFRRTHKGTVDFKALEEMIRANIESQVPLVNQGINKLLETRNIGWDGASAYPVFAQLGSMYRLSKYANRDIYSAWVDESNIVPDYANTVFSVINAVTRSGRNSTDQATWVSRDELGGRLLDLEPNQWRNVFSRANSMSLKEVEASFPALS